MKFKKIILICLLIKSAFLPCYAQEILSVEPQESVTSIQESLFEKGVLAYQKKDYSLAFSIFLELAENGHIDALNNLGTMYQMGMGTKKDYVKAVESYRIAASEGHIDAAINLSTLYRLGIGIKKDISESYAWILVASRFGNNEAVSYQTLMKRVLKPEDLIKANIAAKAYLDYLSNREIRQSWLLPSYLKLEVVAKEHQIHFSLEEKNKYDAQQEALKEEKSSILNTQDHQPIVQNNTSSPVLESRLPIEEDPAPEINIPKGFSLIKPKNKSNVSVKSMPEEPPAQMIGDVKIPKGFSVLKPNSTPSKKEPSTPKDKEDIKIKENLNIAEKNVKNPKKIQLGMLIPAIKSSSMNTDGLTLYHPSPVPITHDLKNVTVLRPRRVIPVNIDLVHEIEVAAYLKPFIQSLANANQVPRAKVIAALKIANPDYFENNPPLRAINSNVPMNIPDSQQIKNAPINKAFFPENE